MSHARASPIKSSLRTRARTRPISLQFASICISSLLIICQFQSTFSSSSTSAAMQSSLGDTSATTTTAASSSAGPQKSSQLAMRPAGDELQQEVELAPTARSHSRAGWTSASSWPPVGKLKRREQHGRIYRIRAAGVNGSFSSSADQLELKRASRPDEPAGSQEAEPAGRGLAGSSLDRADVQSAQQFGARSRTARLLKLGQQQQLRSSSQKGCDHAAELAESTAAEASSISASSQTLRLNSRPSASGSGSGSGGLAPTVVVLRPLPPAGEQELDSESSGLAPADQQEASSAGQQQVEPLARSRESSILSLIDEFDSKITTNRTQAQLACDSGEMVVRLNFTQPFKGIVYPEHNRLSPCRFFGDGHHNYELRLPLRGCGTKQVAPRVFVNDVIVRFHKTLELEEDEVKTLICRYPAPLDAASGQQAGGGGGQQRERLAAANGLVHELAHANRSQLEQFELLEQPQTAPTGATKTNRFGQQELFGELLLAPPGASRTLQELQQLQRLQRQRNRQHADLILAPPVLADTKSQATNSRLFEAIGDQGDTLQATSGANSQQAGFLDRFTSVELLFLISSLVFLALLALALLLSYWCFWRRRRRAAERPLAGAGATSAARRKLRYFNAPHLASAAAGTRPLYTPTQHYADEATPSSLYHQARQQQQQQSNALYYQHQQQQQQQYLSQMGGASSPDDSDVSGRVLLPQPQPHPTGSRHLQPNLMLATNGVTLQRAARRQQADFERADELNSSASRHYKASTIARHQPALAAVGRRARDASSMSQTLGRRAEHERRAGYLASNLRELDARYGQQQQQRQQRDKALAKSSTLTNFHSAASCREPLLKLAPLEQQARGLRQASSMLQLASEKHQQQLARFREEPAGLRQERAPASAHKPHEYQEQEAFVDYQKKRASVSAAAAAGQRLVDINSSPSASSSTSGSPSPSEAELELENQSSQARQLNSATGPEPKLVLKSIEDSFVTNFTEIHEQEYRKYDNRRPFSLAEWRASQPQPATGAPTGSLRRQERSGQREAQTSSEEASEHGQEMDSARNFAATAGLRSLTELDVNFAKSLPRPQRAGGRMATEQAATLSHTQSTPKPEDGTRRQRQQVVESPDLIISSDYNFGRFKLVEGEPCSRGRAEASAGAAKRTEGAKTPGGESHESISYV